MFVDPAQIATLAKRFPELGRLRLVVTRVDEQDVMILKAEAASDRVDLRLAVEAALLASTKMKGAVELVPPGSLPNDGKMIADERPVS
jgi:phenylacetate-CoA ligase